MFTSPERTNQLAEAHLSKFIGELHPLTDARELIFSNVVSHSTILRMAKNRQFPAFKLRGGKWYFVLEVAQEWLMQQYHQAGWQMSLQHPQRLVS